ncbi:hypothetical protein [Lacticaseibacillus sp. GG6-2]
MHEEDFMKMLKDLSSRSEHQLMLVTAPTGTGKTHAIVWAICRYAAEHDEFRAFFVTDQRKNLNDDEFRKAWRAVHPGDFYQHAAVIRSLPDTAKLVLDEWKAHHIPNRLLTPKLEQALEMLQQQLAYYEQAQKHEVGVENAWTELSHADFAVRTQLTVTLMQLADVAEPLAAAGQAKIRNYVATHDTDVCRWLNQYYPTIDLARRQLLIMTTAKFISSYTPFFKEYSIPFLHSAVLTNATVVLDEFDSTKGQLWDKVIEDTLKVRVDLVSLFEAVYQGLKRINASAPAWLNDSFANQNQFNAILARAETLRKRFALDHLYKNLNVSRDPGFVLHTAQRTLMSRGQAWHAHLDEQRNQVLIGTDVADDQHFQSMLGQVSRFLRHVSRFVVTRGYEYQNFHNSALADQESGLTIRDACYAIYDALGLAADQINVLLALGLDRQMKKLPLTQQQPNSYHRFQEQGLSFFNFVDADTHDFRTTINAAFFSMTSERYLLAVLNKANVLGLSATAMLPSVLDNYDLAYLKEKLGDRMVDGAKFFSAQTVADLDLRKRYSDAGVTIQPQVCATADSFAALLDQRAPQQVTPQKARELDAGLETQINLAASANPDTTPAYIKRRYLALFDSFILFLSDPQMTSFLGLQALKPDANKPEMSTPYVEDVFSQLAHILAPDEEQHPKLSIIAAVVDGQVAAVLEDALQLPAEKQRRLYLLSAYGTIAVGQNLQHKLDSLEKEFAVSVAPQAADAEDPRRKTVDLAGIYLGDVTHILSNEKQFTMTKAGLRMITELEYLFDANEISMTTLNANFQALQQSRPRKQPQSATSLVVSYSRMIIQALGRMNRSFNKMPRLRLLATSNVLTKISHIGVDPATISPEYQSLLAFAREQPRNLDETDMARKENRTWYTHRDLKVMVSGLQTNEAVAAYYRHLRDFILANPLISSEQLAQVSNDGDFQGQGLQYIEAPKDAVQYLVKRHQQDDGHFEFKDGNMVISAEAAGLPAMCGYPGFAEAMRRAGYPSQWQPAEYIINPVQFINLYLGALGEFAGQYIVEHEWSVKLQGFEKLSHNELFDFKTDRFVAVDFKNWRGFRNISGDEARRHVLDKLDVLEADTGHSWRVLVINIVATSPDSLQLSADGRILEVPGLIDDRGQNVLSPADKMQIGAFFIGETTDPDHKIGL